MERHVAKKRRNRKRKRSAERKRGMNEVKIKRKKNRIEHIKERDI
jgi:hypothetical protein